jgi:hypothetical protein
MRLSIRVLSSLCYCEFVWAQLVVVDQYIATESPIRKPGLLAHIGPSGSKSTGTQVVWAQSSVVDEYVATESPIAKAGLLSNIGFSGSKSTGAKVHLRQHDSLIFPRISQFMSRPV